MSHTAIEENICLEDAAILVQTCKELGLEAKHGTHDMYPGQPRETGIAIKLPGWARSIVVRADGSVATDAYGNKSGAQEALNKLKANYGANKAIAIAAKQGRKYGKVRGADGKIRVTVVVG